MSSTPTNRTNQGPTPGPWTIDDAGPNSGNLVRIEIVANNFKICDIEDSAIELMGKPRKDAEKRDAANARLIAAAPDLFEACVAALPHVPGVAKHARDLLIAAIAKAEGK